MGHPAEITRNPEGLHLDAGASDADKVIKEVAGRTPEGRHELLRRLGETAKPLNLQVIPVRDSAAAAQAIAQLVREKTPEWGSTKSVVAWRHPLIDALDLPHVLSDQNVPVYITETVASGFSTGVAEERERIRREITDSFVGVTSADFCLAETATLVIKTRPHQARAVSLLPSIHVAVIRLEQVLANLRELYVLLKWDPAHQEEGLTNCMTMISGPSKTADIELVMVHGAHGPRELHLCVITGP